MVADTELRVAVLGLGYIGLPTAGGDRTDRRERCWAWTSTSTS
jgi:UDP-N-acetyl-D-mannosaminuronate dehydrogenase